jgi:hypothetical protein
MTLMAHSSLIGKPSQRPPSLSLLQVSEWLSTIVTVLLLVFSFLALPVTAFYDQMFSDLAEPMGSHPTVPCLLVIVGGSLLLVAGWRFPALRLTWWQVGVILLGICLGLGFSLQHVAYQDACCMFGYQIGQGYPFPAVEFSYVSEYSLSWNQVYAMLRQHPDEVTRQIAWPGMIANSMFYAHLTLIPVAILGVWLRRVGRVARRS